LNHNTTGDGILTALMVLSIMVRRGKPLSELARLFDRFPQKLINVRVKQRIPFEELSDLQAALKRCESKLDSNGRVLLRYSGTEPKARVMVECADAGLCTQIAEELAASIKQAIGEEK